MGKGSGRRIEDTNKVTENLGKIKWGVRDKSDDDFKVRENGKLGTADNSRTQGNNQSIPLENESKTGEVTHGDKDKAP